MTTSLQRFQIPLLRKANFHAALFYPVYELFLHCSFTEDINFPTLFRHLIPGLLLVQHFISYSKSIKEKEKTDNKLLPMGC